MNKLDAINEMLGALNEAPVNTLEDPQNIDVINAIKTLDRVNRQIQSKGWVWNILENYTLNPDVYTQKILWDTNILYIVGTDGTKYTRQGDYLYDFTNKKDTFDNAVQVCIIYLLDYEDMPFPMRNYIVTKATRRFQAETMGDESLDQVLYQREMEAWASLQEYELEIENYNVFNLRTVMERGQR